MPLWKMLVIPVRLCKHHPRQGNVLKMWSPHNNLFHLGKYFWKYFDFFVPRKILLPCTGNFPPQSHQINPSAISNTSLCSAKYFSQSHQINPQFDQITFLAVSCSASSTLMSSKKTLGQVSDKEQQRSYRYFLYKVNRCLARYSPRATTTNQMSRQGHCGVGCVEKNKNARNLIG